MADNWSSNNNPRYTSFPPDSENPHPAPINYGSSRGSFSLGIAPTNQTNAESARARFNRLANHDTEKNALIEDLLGRLEQTELQLQQLRLDHEREQVYNREGQKQKSDLESRLRYVQSLMQRNSYIVALLDGDGMIFNDELLQQGEKGGKEAANQLWSAINEFVKENMRNSHAAKILVRIYANIRGLADILYKTGIIDRASLFEDFVRGFTGSKLLFDFVDVGTGKDKADDKITKMSKLHLHDVHCQQVLLGCSHDNGYARLLENIIGDEAMVNRITLLEGCPFERELANLQDQFETCKFDDLFRSSKIPTAYQLKAGTGPGPIQRPLQSVPVNVSYPGSTTVQTSHGAGDENTPSSTSKSNTPQPATWATMTAAPFGSATSPNAPPATKLAVPPQSTPEIKRNRHGQRIDILDDSVANDELRRVKKLKLCNTHFLSGDDGCTSSRCTHNHEYKVTKNELKVLRLVARMTPCYNKTDCDDAYCIYGHRCPQSQPGKESCYFKDTCRFDGWGHGIDTRAVKLTKV